MDHGKVHQPADRFPSLGVRHHVDMVVRHAEPVHRHVETLHTLPEPGDKDIAISGKLQKIRTIVTSLGQVVRATGEQVF